MTLETAAAQRTNARPAPLPPALEWQGALDGHLQALDQSCLPHERRLLELRTAEAVADAIRRLAIRGAPMIGVAAAYGLYLGVREIAPMSIALLDTARHVAAQLLATRPTAVNLRWALDRCLDRLRQDHEVPALLAEAARIERENTESSLAIAKFGMDLVPTGGTALTHCNAGPLACGGLGTALGCLIAAHRAGRSFRVLADETRPLLQGARLTALELAAEGIDVAVVPDGASPSLIARGEVQAVFVGAARIARNGDFANKIGTYPLALAAHAHGVPFYVAAPMSTFDPAIADGRHIPIEERAAAEVLTLNGTALTAEGIGARNPAFDVSPAGLVTAFVTERGVLRPPFASAIKAAFAVCR